MIQKYQPYRRTVLRGLFFTLIFLILLFLLVYRLDDYPSLWWDEGWTLDAARNWIEHGFLGHYLDGIPVPPRIPVRFPVLVPVTISMRLLGIGIWQGRLSVVMFTLISIGMSMYLCSVMYTRRAGFIALVTTVIIPPFIFHPLVMGRQILAEMPMIFFLLAGYSMLWLTMEHSPWWGLVSALFFGFGLLSKLQVPPFWILSMLLAIWLSATHRQRRLVVTLVWITLGSILVASLIYFIQNKLMPGSFGDPQLTKLLLNSVIVVLNWRVRLIAMIIVLLYGVPQLISLVWAGKELLPLVRKFPNTISVPPSTHQVHQEILRLGVWGFSAGWLLWYLGLGLSWERYLFPPFFIGCLFLAGFIDKLTSGISPTLVMYRTSRFLFHREFSRINLYSIILLVIFSLSIPNLITSIQKSLNPPDAKPIEAAKYLINYIPAGTRIETFESELLFLAPSFTYLYPSDTVSMQLNRKSSINPEYPVFYDPLKANPDYLVIGPMGKMWGLYDKVIADGSFQLEAEIGDYKIYHLQGGMTNK